MQSFLKSYTQIHFTSSPSQVISCLGLLALVPRQLDPEGDSQLAKLLHVVKRELFVIHRIARRVDVLVRVLKRGFYEKSEICVSVLIILYLGLLMEDSPMVKADWYPAAEKLA